MLAAPLIFAVELYTFKTADHDGDSVPTVDEDIDGNHHFSDDVDDTDGVDDFDGDDGGLEDAGGTSVVMHTWQRTNVASAPAGGGGSEGAPANMHYKGYCDASLKWCDTWTCNGEMWCNGNGNF